MVMAFASNNEYWRLRSSHGRKRSFSSADALWSACVAYFEWVEANPLYSTQVMKFQGEATLVKVPKPRAMTIEGLCLHIGVSRETWGQYRKPDHDFSDVCSEVEMVIRTQKFEGAAADLFNASIIARDLGLVDKRENETVVQTADPLTEIMHAISQQRLDLSAK